MERFRIRTGELLGIVIPGIVLLVNIGLILMAKECAFVSVLLAKWQGNSLGNQAISIFLVFIGSYVIGFALRLLPPDPLDRMSAALRAICKLPVRKRTQYLGEQFPYWRMFAADCSNVAATQFGNVYCNRMSDDFKLLEDSDLSTEPNDKTEKAPDPAKPTAKPTEPDNRAPEQLRQRVGFAASFRSITSCLKKLWKPEPHNSDRKARMIFNTYKLVISMKSSSLADEVLFAEGITRLLIGLVYASAIGLLALGGMVLSRCYGHCGSSALAGGVPAFFWINGMLFLFFLYHLRHVRAREAFVVYFSYGVVNSTSEGDRSTNPQTAPATMPDAPPAP